MSILEQLPTGKDDNSAIDQDVSQEGMRVSIIDGMAEVQSLDKPEWVKTCSDLGGLRPVVSTRSMETVMKFA